MCGKPEVNSSLVADEDEESNSSSNDTPDDSGNSNSNNKRNETPEEKRRRRKLERRQRKRAKQEQKGKLVLASNQSAPRKLMTLFNTVWDNETEFVTSQVLACLPEVRQPGLQLDDEERTDEYLNQWDDAGDDKKEKEKTQKFFAKVRRNLISQGVAPQTERAKSYQELRERLHRKIAELAQKPNVEKREKKQKKKLKRAEERKSNKGKKLISQSASTAGGASKEDKDGAIKSETPEKTPLTKKPVVKSNGEIVYSKFDFISSDSRSKTNGIVSMSDSLMHKKSKGKPTPEELLKKAEKHEKQISSLATLGKKSEAADLASSQKWETALKRAEGQKIRDDPRLLKKTIKKNEKLKQTTKKKWKERVERVEKQKELRQQKRQTNIESRRDEKKKRIKKLMRKRGRIA